MAGVLSDLIILALPAVGLWNLQMRRAQKIGVFASLSFGVFACVIEVLRVYFLFALGPSQDITWTYTDSMIWSAVELSIAVTCASTPAMAPLLKRAQRGPNVREPSPSHRGLLSSQASSLKAKMKHVWRRSGQVDSDSLVELVADSRMRVDAQKNGLGNKSREEIRYIRCCISCVISVLLTQSARNVLVPH